MLSGLSLQILITSLCGLDFALFGYDQGVFGGVLLMPGFENDFPKVMEDADLQGIVSSLYTLGCFFGACYAFFVSDKLGRVKSVLLGTIILSVGTVLQCTAYHLAHLIIGRLVTGFGNGITTAVVPTYQSETSKAHRRGQMLVIEFILNIVGYSLSNWTSYGLLHLDKVYEWRINIALQAFFIIPILILLVFVPESPRWLIAHGRRDEARNVIAHLMGKSYTVDHPEVVEAEKIIHHAVEHEKSISANVTWRDFFKGGKLQTNRRVFLSANLQFFQQFTGINIFSYYLPIILQNSLHYSKMTSSLVASIGSVVYLAATFPPLFYIERAGRKLALMGGSFGQFICCVMLCAALKMLDMHPEKSSQYGLWGVAFIFIFMICFGGSWLSVAWLMTPELAVLRVRSQTAAIGTASVWLSNFIVVEITPKGQESLGWKFYIIFAIFNLFFVPMIYFFYPETKGLSLEQMDSLFEMLEGKWTVIGLDYSKVTEHYTDNSSANNSDVEKAPQKTPESSSVREASSVV